MHLGRNANSGKVEQRFGDIDIQGHGVAHRAGLDLGWIPNNKRHPDGILVKEPLVVPAVLPQKETLIGSINNDGVILQTLAIDV